LFNTAKETVYNLNGLYDIHSYTLGRRGHDQRDGVRLQIEVFLD